jgi:hypothetical protein
MRILVQSLKETTTWYTRHAGPIVLAALLTSVTLASSSAQVLLLSGQIVNSSGQALPGCLLSVVSLFGRSAPTFSQGDGSFRLEVALPPDSSPAASSTPFLEVYWNKDLMYRQPVNSLRIQNAQPKLQTISGQVDWADLLHDGGRVEVAPIRVGR